MHFMMRVGVVAHGGSRRQDKDLGAPNFGALLDASPDALLAVNADGTINMANTACGRLFGYTHDDRSCCWFLSGARSTGRERTLTFARPCHC